MTNQVRRFVDRDNEPISLVAVGASNGLGFNAHQTWALFRARVQAFVEGPFRCANGAKSTLCHQRSLPPQSFGWFRMSALAYQALEEIAPALGRLPREARIQCFIGLGERFGDSERRGETEGRAARRKFHDAVQRWFARASRRVPIRLLPTGHASFGEALLEAIHVIVQGECDAAVVGGVDTYYDPDAIEQLLVEERLFDLVDVHRIIPGEGAGFALLCSPATARRERMKAMAYLRSVAAASEPAPLFSEHPPTARGLTQTLIESAASLREAGEPLEWIVGDVSQEDYRVQEFALAYPRLLAPGGLDTQGLGFQPVASMDLRVDFLPAYFGDLGAAMMPTATAIAVQSFLRGAPPARNCLIFASSVTHAARAALCLERVTS